jgi:cation diffusion facilitator CzcD-associated flavoprotein CzcO
MGLTPVKRIAIIGLGPAGAIAIDAFAQEQAFDLIRVFERREAPGGCWFVLHTRHYVRRLLTQFSQAL